MNANIFSCTVPPLLVLETQIIHPELLQFSVHKPMHPTGIHFFGGRMRAGESVCGLVQTGARGRRRVRAHADVCIRTHPSARAVTRLRSRAPVCTRPHPSTRALR